MAILLLLVARLHDVRLVTRTLSRLALRAFRARSWPFETSGALRLTAIAGIALALAGCAKGKGMAGFQMPPVPVEVAEARPQMVRDQLRTIGGIEAQEIIEVTSEIDAIVRTLPFAEGQPVRQGALIAQMDDREIRATAARAQAQREQAQANAERGEKLYQQQVISEQQRDDVRTAFKVAEADEALAKARLAKTRVVAPFTGLVGRRRVSPGAYLRAGNAITELARVNEMKVSFAAPERFLPSLKRGIPVEIFTPAYPGQPFQGHLQVVDPIVDPETRTIQLVAWIPNRDHRLKPGMSANVSVTTSEHPSALVIPNEAVFAEGSQNFVYIVKPDSTVVRAAVELGLRDSTQVEVLHGLEAGMRVVRAGHQKLFDGAHVVPVEAGPQRAAELGPGSSGGASASVPSAKRAAKPDSGTGAVAARRRGGRR